MANSSGRSCSGPLRTSHCRRGRLPARCGPYPAAGTNAGTIILTLRCTSPSNALPVKVAAALSTLACVGQVSRTATTTSPAGGWFNACARAPVKPTGPPAVLALTGTGRPAGLPQANGYATVSQFGATTETDRGRQRRRVVGIVPGRLAGGSPQRLQDGTIAAKALAEDNRRKITFERRLTLTIALLQ